jgi:transposase
MNFIGVDLHKKIITVCVMNENRTVLARTTLFCIEPEQIVAFFRQFRPFKVAVEATASYLWLVELLDPLAEKVVLANPKKLRVIAESTKKTDRLDAQTLAEFLARDMIPEAYMPTPRQRQHRILVRHRQNLKASQTSVRCRIHHMLADHNADRKDLFSAHFDKAYLKGLPLSDAERFVLRQLWSQFQDCQAQLLALAKKIKAFAAKAPKREAEARKILKTAPGVGTVTAEVILSELGDVSRFRNAKAVCAYAGLVPVVKQSGGKRSKDLGISKQGSGLLRWAMVETAWRLVKTSLRWTVFFSRLRKRSGTKRAIVAVARKYLCVLYAMLKTSTPYRVIPILTEAEFKAFKTTRQGLETVSTPEEVVPAETQAPTTKRRTSARRSTSKETVTT